jgi:uncharacterized protein
MLENNESENQGFNSKEIKPISLPEVSISLIFATFGLFCLLGMGFATGISLLLGKFYGLDVMEISTSINENATPIERSFVRWILLLNHLGMFVLPGFLTVWLFFKNKFKIGGQEFLVKKNWKQYLMLTKMPSFMQISMGLVLLSVALPLVYYLYSINKLLPLPEWMHSMEGQTNDAIKGILKMDNFGELLANVTIMALIPAIGEELVFRGILQQQLMRKLTPIVSILLAGAIFSAIHFQFEGFFSRWLLGALLGWLYWRTQNFWVPVAAHFFNNAFQVVAQYFYASDLSTMDLEKDVEVPWFVAAISVFLIVVVMRFINQTSARETEKND